MNRTLQVAFPHVYCELDFTDPLELSVAAAAVQRSRVEESRRAREEQLLAVRATLRDLGRQHDELVDIPGVAVAPPPREPPPPPGAPSSMVITAPGPDSTTSVV